MLTIKYPGRPIHVFHYSGFMAQVHRNVDYLFYLMHVWSRYNYLIFITQQVAEMHFGFSCPH